MMCIVTITVMVPTLAVNSLSYATEVGSGDNWHSGEELTRHSMQSYMLDGVSLAEYQHQQIRDLTQQARYERFPANVNEPEMIHCLVATKDLNENAVCVQVEKTVNE